MEIKEFMDQVELIIQGLNLVRGPSWKDPFKDWRDDSKIVSRLADHHTIMGYHPLEAVKAILETRGLHSYINEDEKFWPHSFRIHMHQFDVQGVVINATDSADALDIVVDYAKENDWKGLYWESSEEAMLALGIDDEELERQYDCGELVFAGKDCLTIQREDFQIVQLD